MYAISSQIKHAKPTQYALLIIYKYSLFIVIKVPICKKKFLRKSGGGEGGGLPLSPRWRGPW